MKWPDIFTPADKRGHIILGAAVCATSMLISLSLGLSWRLSGIVGASACIAAGIAKEIYDSFHPKNHTVDAWDAIATFIGGAAVVAMTASLILVGRALRHLLLLTLILFGVVSCGGPAGVVAKSTTTPAEAATRDMFNADKSLRTRVTRLETERTALANDIEKTKQSLAQKESQLSVTTKELSSAREDLVRSNARLISYCLFALAVIAVIASLWLPVAGHLCATLAAVFGCLGAAAFAFQAIYHYVGIVSVIAAAIGAIITVRRLHGHSSRQSSAVTDAVHFGDQIAALATRLGATSEVIRLKGEAIARQVGNDTKPFIESALQSIAQSKTQASK